MGCQLQLQSSLARAASPPCDKLRDVSVWLSHLSRITSVSLVCACLDKAWASGFVHVYMFPLCWHSFAFFFFCLSRSSKTCRRLLHLPVHHHLWVHHYSVDTRIFQLRPIDVLKFGCNSNIIDENKNHQAQSQNKYCTSLCRQQKLSFVILLKGIFLHDRKYDWYHYHIFVWSMNMHKPILVIIKLIESLKFIEPSRKNWWL